METPTEIIQNGGNTTTNNNTGSRHQSTSPILPKVKNPEKESFWFWDWSAILRSKWTMLSAAFLIMFTNSLVNISVKSLTTDLKDHLKCSETQIQTFTVSAAYVLSIPLSLYGSFIIHKVGTSKSLILWTAAATVGWVCFAFGVAIKSLVIINIGRLLQGGAFGAMRVSFNAFCVKWFGKKHIAMSMGVLRSAHNIAHVVGSMLVLHLLKEKLEWTPVTTFWVEALGLIACTLLAVFMWLSAKANFKMQERQTMIIQSTTLATATNTKVMIDATGNPKKSKKSIVFPTQGQVQVTRKRDSSSILVTNSDEEEETDKVGVMTNHKVIIQHLRALFTNPIFVIIIVIGLCYDGTVLCFSGILKRLLKEKFHRSEERIGVEMGFTKYCGFAAPIAGYIIDRVRNREWFMLTAGVSLTMSTFSLWNSNGDDITVMYLGLLGISFGQVCYGNSFWPAIASIAGREYQIVAYGFMGAVCSTGAVIMPQIVGTVIDKSGNIQDACLVFAILSGIGLMACIVIIAISKCFYQKIDYLNRELPPKNMRRVEVEDIEVQIDSEMTATSISKIEHSELDLSTNQIDH